MFCPKTLLLLLSLSVGHYANNSIPKRSLVPFDIGGREDVDGLLHAIMVVCVCDCELCVSFGYERAVSGTSAALIWSRDVGVVASSRELSSCSPVCAPGVQFFVSTFPASRTAATNSSSEPSSHLPSLPQPSRSSTSSRLP